jgi:hypothetical protein
LMVLTVSAWCNSRTDFACNRKLASKG